MQNTEYIRILPSKINILFFNNLLFEFHNLQKKFGTERRKIKQEPQNHSIFIVAVPGFATLCLIHS